MSFSLLPWPLLIAIVIISEVVIIKYIKDIYKDSPKTFSIGLGLTALGAIMAIIRKFLRALKILQGQSWLGLMVAIFTIFGILLLMIGIYIKTKDDPYKRKVILLLSIGMAITLFFMLLIVLSCIYK